MFNVHIYDFKEKKPYVTPLTDPFNTPVVIGRYEVYDATGDMVIASGKRRVRNLANYGSNDANFLPLQLLRVRYINPNLSIKNIKRLHDSKFRAHTVITIA